MLEACYWFATAFVLDFALWLGDGFVVMVVDIEI